MIYNWLFVNGHLSIGSQLIKLVDIDVLQEKSVPIDQFA